MIGLGAISANKWTVLLRCIGGASWVERFKPEKFDNLKRHPAPPIPRDCPIRTRTSIVAFDIKIPFLRIGRSSCDDPKYPIFKDLESFLSSFIKELRQVGASPFPGPGCRERSRAASPPSGLPSLRPSQATIF